MAKADLYTADGREAIAKAREADVEDRTYQIGEISQKTGLQKTAEGWVTPKGKANAAIEAKGKSEKAETSFGKVVQENGKWGVRTKMGSHSSFMPAESEADAMEALKNLTEGFESVGGNKYTFKKSEATKAQEAYEKNQKKIASENKKKNSLENAKKMAESYRKTSNKPIYITEKDGDYVVAKGRGELEYAKENGYRLVPEGENAPRQLTGDCKITIKG